MASISAARALIDDVSLAVQRTLGAEGALGRLVGHASAADDVTRAVRSGGSRNDPFRAVRDLADGGNSALLDAWTQSEAAATMLARAVERHPGGPGSTQLLAAREAADQASGDLGSWIARGAPGSIESLEAIVRPQLERVRAMAALVAQPAS